MILRRGVGVGVGVGCRKTGQKVVVSDGSCFGEGNRNARRKGIARENSAATSTIKKLVSKRRILSQVVVTILFSISTHVSFREADLLKDRVFLLTQTQ